MKFEFSKDTAYSAIFSLVKTHKRTRNFCNVLFRFEKLYGFQINCTAFKENGKFRKTGTNRVQAGNRDIRCKTGIVPAKTAQMDTLGKGGN